MNHRKIELGGQALGDQRSVAGLGIALDAQKRRRRVARQLGHDRREVDPAEDLAEITLAVLGRELDARALPDAMAVVRPVLELPELGGRRDLL